MKAEVYTKIYVQTFFNRVTFSDTFFPKPSVAQAFIIPSKQNDSNRLGKPPLQVIIII